MIIITINVKRQESKQRRKKVQESEQNKSIKGKGIENEKGEAMNKRES